MKQMLNEILAQHTGRTQEQVDNDTERALIEVPTSVRGGVVTLTFPTVPAGFAKRVDDDNDEPCNGAVNYHWFFHGLPPDDWKANVAFARPLVITRTVDSPQIA